MAKQSKSLPRKSRLGRGLSGLIVDSSKIAPEETVYQSDLDQLRPPALGTADSDVQSRTAAPVEILIEQISTNPYQPRKRFSDEDISQLAESIDQQGILQPLLVTPGSDSGTAYQLIAGQRRLMAARKAGLKAVPCVVRKASRQEMLEWALVENIQREDLNPIERANAYHQYMDSFGLTQAQVAERLGQSRPTVANYLRLLDLSDPIQDLLLEKALTFGHAKALASLANEPKRQMRLAKMVITKGLSVRQLERLVGMGRSASGMEQTAVPKQRTTPYLLNVEQQLSEAVGTRVTIKPGRAKNAGRIVIDYYSLDDFDRISSSLGASIQS